MAPREGGPHRSRGIRRTKQGTPVHFIFRTKQSGCQGPVVPPDMEHGRFSVTAVLMAPKYTQVLLKPRLGGGDAYRGAKNRTKKPLCPVSRGDKANAYRRKEVIEI